MLKQNEKINCIEILRIVSMISVVLLHITSTAWFYVEQNTATWYIYNAMRCTCKWGVTVFVMISGAVFLRKEYISIRMLWGKYIKRIAEILIFWSFVYAILPLFKTIIYNGNMENWNIWGGVKSFILGENHLWYLYMCIGLYMMIPFMKEISNDKNLLTYFIILSILFTIIIPSCQKVSIFRDSVWNQFLGKFSIQMVIGYPLYFFLGYYWIFTGAKSNWRYLLYVFAGMVYLISIFLTARSGGKHFLVDGTMSIGNFIITNAVFVFGMKLSERLIYYRNLQIWINKAASFSLGIYLVHMLFVRSVTKWVTTSFTNPWLVVGVITIIVMGGSFVMCYIIKKIPILCKLV